MAPAHFPVKQEDMNLWGVQHGLEIETVEKGALSFATFARLIWT